MSQIKALKRDKNEDVKSLRIQGIVPAVVYGPKQEAISIKMDSKEFDKAYKLSGESTVVDLLVDGESHDVLIHAVDRDPVRDTVTHVDFYAIEKGKKVTVGVELVFSGESPAEKTLGGVLVKVLHEVEVEAMPKDLPHELTVDLSILTDFEKQILAKDIILPAGVELTINPEEVVALVQAPRGGVEEEPVEAVDMSKIEVVGKKKEEEEVKE